MEEKIIEILKNVLGTNNVTAETSQQNCAEWDSLRHLSIVVELESEFDISLEPEEIAEMKSVKNIEEIIHKKMKCNKE